MYDLLTGLPNRNMLQYQLKKSLAALERKQGQVAVLFLDLDDLREQLSIAWGMLMAISCLSRQPDGFAPVFAKRIWLVGLVSDGKCRRCSMISDVGDYPAQVAQKS
ncbi:MAG: diguanylate cyclase [Rheinheimera sp.]|nr:diguanylate cyclase [Rheinheimera sp.]